MKNLLPSFLAAVVLATPLGGCGTIVVGQGLQSVRVSAGSVRAKYTVTDLRRNVVVKQGLTPDVIGLDRSSGYFEAGKYRIDIVHPETKEVHSTLVKGKPNNWYIWGNLAWLPLFLIGSPIAWLGIDPATGAMWKLRPKAVETNF